MSEKEMFVVKFDYNKGILDKIATDARSIDLSNIEEVSTKVKELVKIRRAIEAQGKSFRDEANAYNKRVLDEEKEYKLIIEPIELEYKDLLEKEEQKKVIEARKELLPMKKKQLQSLTKIVMTDDETILAMNDEQWVAYYSSQFQINEERIQYQEMRIRQEKERIEREAEIRAEMEVKAQQDKILAEIQAQEDQKRAVEAEKAKAEELLNQEKERADKAKNDEIQAIKDLADKEIAEKAKLESNKKYQDFLSNNNYNESTDIIEKNESEVKVYRLVATYKNN